MANANKTTITAEPGKQEMLITREFDVPRELVFKAFTDPELYVQWLGPRRLTMTLETFEPRSGGRWRYIHKEWSKLRPTSLEGGSARRIASEHCPCAPG